VVSGTNFLSRRLILAVLALESQLDFVLSNLRPAAFISTKKKGNALIVPGLSDDFIADIFT